MKTAETKTPAFLTGGGEMGELTRLFDWSKTSVGSPDIWPQSLRIAVRIMLDSPFGMYIAWGNEYIQLYNDGYRPILGATKHPQALGISTRQTFAEVWPTIGPMFEGVMQGKAVGFPDFVLQLDRNGFLEECVFDFSYSPIRLEDGEVGGVLVTVIETTEKVKAAKALKESEQELQFAIEAADLGTWDLNPATNKFRGNSRLKEWFGLKPNEEIELPLALAVIADNDRDKVTAAIQTALQFSSGGHYDIVYTIIHPQTKNEKIVRAKGRASFNDEGIAYRFNGTLQDVTKEIVAGRLLTESEQRLSNERQVLYNSFMNVPAGIAIVKGDTFIYEFANAAYEKLVGRKITPGKTVQELFPEFESQGLIDILINVFSTKQPFIANEFPVELKDDKTGNMVLGYYNTVVQPMMDENGKTERLLSHGVEVSQHVAARKLIEESEIAMRKMASYLKLATDSANVGTWLFTMQTQKLEWSNVHKKMWGYEEHRTDLTYEDWHKVILPEDKEKAFEKIEEAKVNHTEYEALYYIKRENDGALRYMRSFGKYQYNDEGEAQTLTGITMDITKQKEAEEQLIESEAKFRVLSETIPHMIWTATADGKKNFFNKHMLDYTGLSTVDLKDDGWQQTIFTEDLEQDVRNWLNTLATGEDLTAEKRIRRHDGVFRWHLCRSIAQKDNEGKIMGWIGTCTDITEQKAFTEELEKQVLERTAEIKIKNKTFEAAENIAKFGSYKWNMSTGALEYSDNLFRLLDCDPQAFEPSFEKFLSFVHADDAAVFIQNGEETKITGVLVETPYRIVTRTGKLKHFRSSGSFTLDNDKKILVGTVRDITNDVEAADELVEKEDYLNQIITNAPDAVIVCNEKNIITLWNPKTEEIFGWKADEVLGRDLSATIIPPQSREAHRQGMNRLLKTGVPKILNKTLELTALNKAGKEFPISLTVSQAVQHGEKLFIAFLKDITQEKQNEKELTFKSKQLEEINQSLNLKNIELENTNAELASFTYVASHDLQEPLRKIQTFSNYIIEAEKFSEKTHDYFNRIIAAAARMQNLIVSLLDFSRTSSIKLIFEPCNLNKIVEEANEDLQLSIIEKQAVVEHENLPTINGSHIQLSQLFTNIIDNAIKYSRPQVKPHIKITSSIVEGNNIEHSLAIINKQYHKIEIADNGIGFKKEYEIKIFELFQRLHGMKEYSGTGIGLAIVKKIVTNHHGFIVAEGRLDFGSTFIIYIPTA